MRLSTAVSLFLDSRDVKPVSLRWYEHRLGALVETYACRDVRRIEADDLREWRDALLCRPVRHDGRGRPARSASGTLSPHTVIGHLRAAGVFWGWLVDAGLAGQNPASNVRLPDTAGVSTVADRAISEVNIRRMVAAARAMGPLEHALILTLRDTGARVGGVCSMRISTLDLQRRRVEVHEKGDATRVVLFLAETAAALRTYLATRTDAYDALFVGREGPYTTDGIYAVTRRVAEAAGVERPWSPHAFRHALARRMLLAEAGIELVAETLGHASVETTRRFYARWHLAERQRLYEKYAANGSAKNGH